MDFVQTRMTILNMIKYLNFIILFSISMILYGTIEKIADFSNARLFLEQASYLPNVPWKAPVVTLLSYASLILAMQLKKKVKRRERLWFFVLIEVILTALIILNINLSYNGIIFLVVADFITDFKENQTKLIAMLLVIFLLLLSDYNVCGDFLRLISFSQYLTYYQVGVQNTILAIKNVLSSFNSILFIIYCVLLLREEIFEREHIQLLYEKLNEMYERLNRTNGELQKANQELENYVKETAEMTRTKERNRLAREIHDTLGHTLTGIIAGVDACIAMLSIAPDMTKKQLETIGDVARQGMKEVRRSVNALRPDVLEEGGLLGAISKTVEEMRMTANANIILENHIKTLKFNEDEEEVIYRIIQESVTNAIRHGKARNVFIILEREYSIVRIIIRDDGIGAKEIKSGFGLHHMKERVELLKGELQFDGTDGFTVTARIPIRWGGDYD